jgi:hypothetical protein
MKTKVIGVADQIVVYDEDHPGQHWIANFHSVEAAIQWIKNRPHRRLVGIELDKFGNPTELVIRLEPDNPYVDEKF